MSLPRHLRRRRRRRHREEWEQLGFNLDAAVHNDIVSTNDRTVTAMMPDGTERVIYADGQFQTEA